MHVPERVRDDLARALRRGLERGGDAVVEDDDEAAAGRERGVRERLRVGERDRVVRELERRAARERGERREEVRGRAVPVEDVRRAERVQERGVVQGGGGDDGREAGEFRDLDGWMGGV